MQNATQIRILVESRSDEIMANGIFADLLRESAARVVMCWNASSAISLAASRLISETPPQPIALILNCPGSPWELRQPVERILRRSYPDDGLWHVALAIPDMIAWLKHDAQFAAAIQAEEHKRISMNKYDTIVFTKDWLAQHAFNPGELLRQEPEFRSLHEFLMRHSHTAPATG
jgi:hypothetical protein